MLEIKELSKIYKSKHNEVKALDHINLKIEDKGMVFILGKSGSGKSTLLNVLGGLDRFDEGEIIICGKSSKDFKQSDFDSYRNTFIGFIFQEYNVMENFTVKENIALALQLQGKKATKEAIDDILEQVDLTGLASRKPNELSGGQLQRVAIARALIKDPEIIMADEPTGALDSHTGKAVFDTLKKLSQDKLVLIVSHDKEFAKNYADRIIELADGKIVSDTIKTTKEPEYISHGISILNDDFIQIDQNHHYTDEEIQKIIAYLKNNHNETIISFHQDVNHEIKKTNHINENGHLEVFNDTTTDQLNMKDYDGNQFKMIRSKLPFIHSLKFALSNLKLKPFRLVMTILLSTVAFSLFGLANTFACYDKHQTTLQSIHDSNINYLSIGKEDVLYFDDYSYTNSSLLNQDDIDLIQKKYPDIHFTKTYSSNNPRCDFSIENSINHYEKLSKDNNLLFYPTTLSALAYIDETTIKDNDFKLIGQLPTQDQDIVLSKTIAEAFVLGDYQVIDNKGKVTETPINSINDMIGKTISIKINGQNKTFTVTGILDTKLDISRYEDLKTNNQGVNNYYLQEELSTLLNNGFHSLGYVNQNVIENAFNQDQVYLSCDNLYSLDLVIDDEYMDISYFYRLDHVDPNRIVTFDNNQDLYINYNMIKNIKIDNNTTIEDLVLEKANYSQKEDVLLKAAKEVIQEKKQTILKKKLTLSYYDHESYQEQNDNIETLAGVYISDFQDLENSFVLSNRYIDNHQIQLPGQCESLIAKMPQNEETLKDIIRFTYDDHIKESNYTLQNQVMPMLKTVNSVIYHLKDIFMYAGIGFAIFAAVMFSNFIATSIANKQREIGILRAVGARGLDIFKIFVNESLIISLINWICSLTASFCGVLFINNYARNEFHMLVTILDFSIVQVVFILAIALFVALIASAIPVIRISHKKPIDAIKNRK